MSNPVVDLIEWLKKQEPEIQTEIAFLISGMNPNFDFYKIAAITEETPKQFYSRIEEFSGSEIRNTGFIIAFRAIFDFVFLKQRGTVEGWDEPKKLFESVLEDTDPNLPAGMKESAKKFLSELPARRDKWIEVCRDWEVLKESALSDKAIEAWNRSNLATRR